MDFWRKNLALRLFFMALFLVPVIYFNEFRHHFYVYLTGTVLNNVIRNQWHVALLSAALFLVFLIPLSFRRKVRWAEYGLATAFFVSLFVEMYGIPLTVLLASKYFFNPGVNLPAPLVEFHFLGVGFSMDLGMTYGAVLMVAGGLLILSGWVTLYRNVRKTPLVTTGIYSYSRHPQYLGFILIVVGWLVAWPTILTVVMAPILAYKYLKLCWREEDEVSKDADYGDYRRRVPFLL